MQTSEYELNGKSPLPYRFVDFLPALYRNPQECGVLLQFLHGLEHVWGPVEQFLEDVSVLYDTGRTPSSFLPWLADWIGLALDHRWGEAKQRRLLREAVELYQWRGTRRGIMKFLELYTGITPQISEPFLGTPIEGAPFGSATIGDIPEHCFVVTVFLREDERLDGEVVSAIRSILDHEKPAHTAYDLRIDRQRTVR